MAIEDYFVWGSGGSKMTPEQIATLRALEERKRLNGVDTSPVGSWTQGAARVADAIAGSFRRGSLAKAEKANDAENAALVGSLLGGSSAPAAPSPIPAPGAAGEVSATSPVDLSGNDVFNGFIDAVKTGNPDAKIAGVTNPFGLAAVAATGRAESGFSPKNANRTWSDPSASGQPGTAGGIMSWRGPRYQALAATGDLSPAGQGRFFLQENPQLIQALNNAKSVEEAQGLMNRAWAFRGYDQPGGESARRLAYANSFLPQFQGHGSGQEVASLDPEAGMPQPAPVGDAASTQPVPQQAPVLPPPTDVAAAPPVASVPPVQVAQAAPSGAIGSNPATLANAIKVLQNPQANENTKAIAKIIVQQQQARDQAILEYQLKQADPAYQVGLDKSRLELDKLKNPPKTRVLTAEEKQQMGLPADIPFQMGPNGEIDQIGGKGTNVTVNTGENNSKFVEESDKAASGRLNDYVVAGNSASQMMGDVQTLADLGNQITTGRGAEALVALGPYAESLGIDLKGLGPAQAFDSIVSRMAPQMRPAGSGSSSDTDIRLFLKSLPSLGTKRDGNQIITGTLQAVQQNKIDAAEIASKAYLPKEQGGITWQEAEKQIRALPNPYARFKEYQRQQATGEAQKQAEPPPSGDPLMDMPPPQGITPDVWKHVPPEKRKLWQN